MRRGRRHPVPAEGMAGDVPADATAIAATPAAVAVGAADRAGKLMRRARCGAPDFLPRAYVIFSYLRSLRPGCEETGSRLAWERTLPQPLSRASGSPWSGAQNERPARLSQIS